jgi:hypothetical protein
MTDQDHGRQRWPSIPVAGWQDTRDTLHLYTQVVGKIRLANEPLVNHWWNTTLYVTATGLTTSLMPHPTGRAFQIDFDFCAHRLDISSVDGAHRSLPLEDRPVADFHEAVMSMLEILAASSRRPGRSARLQSALLPRFPGRPAREWARRPGGCRVADRAADPERPRTA